MYPASLIGCYKYLSFYMEKWHQYAPLHGIQSPHWVSSVIPGHFTKLCLYIQCREGGNTPTHTLGKLRFYRQCHVAGNRPPTHLLLPSLYTNLWSKHSSSLPPNHPSTHPYSSHHMSILCPKPLSICFVFCCIY